MQYFSFFHLTQWSKALSSIPSSKHLACFASIFALLKHVTSAFYALVHEHVDHIIHISRKSVEAMLEVGSFRDSKDPSQVPQGSNGTQLFKTLTIVLFESVGVSHCTIGL